MLVKTPRAMSRISYLVLVVVQEVVRPVGRGEGLEFKDATYNLIQHVGQIILSIYTVQN